MRLSVDLLEFSNTSCYQKLIYLSKRKCYCKNIGSVVAYKALPIAIFDWLGEHLWEGFGGAVEKGRF